MDIKFFPEAASTYAERVDPLFYWLTGLTLGFTVLVLLAVLYLGVKYRQKHDGRKSYHPHSTGLEIGYASVLLVLALGIYWWGATLFYDAYQVPKDPIEIDVVGKQWMWKIRQPNGKREVNTLHIPVNQPVRLTMTSQDVIHSFFIPAFRMKQDVLPARYTTMWFESTKTGEFPLFCAEYCGTEHSTMVGKVIVLEPDEYTAWLGDRKGITGPQAGAALFQRLGCAACHMAGDLNRGPDLVDLFGSQVELADGSIVTADEEYIRESILKPTAKVVKGFAPLMPSFEGAIDDTDLNNLVEHIRTIHSSSE